MEKARWANLRLPWRWVRLAVGLGLLALLFTLVDWSALLDLLRAASLPIIALLIALRFLTLFLSAWRWQILLRADGLHVPLMRLTRYCLVSLFFNNYLPPIIGADVVRMLTLAESRSPGVRVVSVLTERGFGLLALLLIGALAFAASPAMRAFTLLALLIGAALLAVSGMLAALLIPETWAWALRLPVVRRLGRVRGFLEDIARTGRRYRRRYGALAWTVAISIAIQIVVIGVFHLRALAFGIDLAPAQTMIVAPVIVLLITLPITPGGVGSQEAFFALTYGAIGIGQAGALAIALLARGIDLILSALGAFAWLRGGGAQKAR